MDAFARRFGLSWEGGALGRHGERVTVGELELASPPGRNHALATCLGVRLGLDRRVAERGEGAVVQRLVPRAALTLAAEIAGVEPARREWLPTMPFDLVCVREEGKLTAFEAQSDAQTWDAARRALFYEAYELRPARVESVGEGRLKVFETTGGLAASVATLLPEFDYDAARAGGVAAIPDYDTLLIWQPADGGRVTSAVRRVVRAAYQSAPYPFSSRLLCLRPDSVIPGESAYA